MSSGAALTLLLVLGSAAVSTSAQSRYFGAELGALSELHHGVRGRVYAVDSRTLYLHDFHYDGEGPAAYFYVGTSKTPTAAGATRLRDERGGAGPLRRYRGEGVTLALPEGKTLRDVTWFAVWCDEYSVNFGDVSIPRELEYPRPAKVGALRGVHGVSSDPVVVVDAQTLLVPNFSYDGEAPDAKFWVGRGDKPSPQGIRIPDENGKEAPLRKYDKKTIVLTLPGELTVFDIGHFGVWCEAFTVNFGHVALPRAALRRVPPSLKMLGVSPQSRNVALAGAGSAGQSARAYVHKPIARQDATTYRPPRLGAGPLAALLDASDDRAASLHRRADSYSPPAEQLVSLQPSKEVYYLKQDVPAYQQQNQDHQRLQNQQNYQNQQQQIHNQQQQSQHQNYYNQQQLEANVKNQQQQLHNHQQQSHQEQSQQQNYYNHQQQLETNQHQLQNHNERQPSQLNYHDHQQLLYQQQLYERERLSLERQLLEEQYRQLQFQRQQGPLQYRLLPYQNVEHSRGLDGHRSYREVGGSEVTIQKSVDLDPNAGSGARERRAARGSVAVGQ